MSDEDAIKELEQLQNQCEMAKDMIRRGMLKPMSLEEQKRHNELHGFNSFVIGDFIVGRFSKYPGLVDPEQG